MSGTFDGFGIQRAHCANGVLKVPELNEAVAGNVTCEGEGYVHEVGGDRG